MRPLFLFLIFFSVAARADSDPIPEVNVGSPRVGYPPGLAVIPAADFGPTGSSDPESVLQSIPGLVVNREGGSGQTTFVFIRGTDSEGTMVLLDGLPINDPSSNNKSFDFSSINLNNVERIEVWKGPQSVMFGSGATGGVINIVTKKGDGALQLETDAEEGSFNTTALSQYARGSRGPWSYSLSASGFRTDGISAASSMLGNQERDGSWMADFSARVGWQPSAKSEIELIARHTDKFAKLDYAPSNVGPYDIEADAPNYRSSSNLWTAAIKGRQTWSNELESKWMISRFSQDRGYDDDPDASNSDWVSGHYTGESYHGENSNRWHPVKGLFVSFGPGLDWESAASEWLTGTDTSLAPRKSAWIAGLMVRGQYDRRSLFLTAGAREDHHSVFGDETVYEVSPGWHVTRSTDVFFRAASAYKAPTLYELYAPVYGNPGLQTERVQGTELSLVQYFYDRKIKLEATAFEDEFRNLIQFTQSYSNVGAGVAEGAEVIGDVTWNPIHLMIGYTYLDTRDETTGQSLPRRPRNTLSGKIQFDIDERWSADMEYLNVDRRLDDSPVTARQFVLSGYQIWNASVSWQASSSWKFYLRAENLLNVQYQEVAGYGADPFSFYGGFTYVFESSRSVHLR